MAARLAQPAATGDSTEQALALQPRDAIERGLLRRRPLTQQRLAPMRSTAPVAGDRGQSAAS